MNLEGSMGFHFALFVRGGADVCPRVLVGDMRNCQNVGFLETLGRKLFPQLSKNTDTDKPASINIHGLLKKKTLLPWTI